MALAPLVYTLWNRVMRFDPENPIWPNRDRFVLSNGHASMLLWSVLHLTRTQAVNADYEVVGEPSVSLDDIRLSKRSYGWPEDAKFFVPDGVCEHFDAGIGQRGAAAHRVWKELFTAYREKYPELAGEIDQMQRRELPAGWDNNLPHFPADATGIAGREASGKVLNVLAQNVPWFLGGSADLGPSNKTTLNFTGAGDFQANSPGGRTCTSESASTQWRPLSMGSPWQNCEPSVRPSSSSVTTHGLRFVSRR